VKVQDEAGARFRFVSYVPAGESSKEFVELFGGRRGKEKMRYVRPDRVMAARKAPRRRSPRTTAV
jgi:hypothetical protein